MDSCDEKGEISKLLVICVLFLICVVLFFKLLLPYYSHSIYQWDAVGHVAAAEFVKTNLFVMKFLLTRDICLL